MLRHLPPSLARRALRLTLAGTVACGASGIAVGAFASSAQALDVVTCGGSEVTSFSPALTERPQSVLASTTTLYQPCVNVLRPLELRTGVASGTVGPTVRTCDDLLTARTGQRTVRWSTGTTSTFSFISTVTALRGGVLQVVQQGSITAGEFSGDTAVGVVLLTQSDLDACATTGVASLGGTVTLTIAL